MTGHPITDVTLSLCVLYAVAQWVILALGSSEEYVPEFGCLMRAFCSLPYAALGAVSFAVRSSPLASTVLLGASVAIAVSSFLIYRTTRRDPDNSDWGLMFHFVMTWFIVLISSSLTGAVYILERWL
jgi:hypothetical protein